MFLVPFILAALAAVANGFQCMTVCRKPLWACINQGIPGHDISQLQQCVMDAINAGQWVRETACIACFNQQVAAIDTVFPTGAPVVPVEVDCNSIRRSKTCSSEPTCIWDDQNSSCLTIGAPGVNMTPTPTDAGGQVLDDMQPCLTYCREQAMDCAFTHGVDTTCVPCMRECVFNVASDQTNQALYLPECSQCIGDVFEVIGDPQNPPDGGFRLFGDYQKWVRNKGMRETCREAGGKWKEGANKNRCVAPKSKGKLRCKKVRNTDVCAALGCTFNTKKSRCAGAHKWKSAQSRNRGSDGSDGGR